MKKNSWIRLVFGNSVVALVFILVYGVLGCSFRSDNTIKQALAITVAPVFGFAFIWLNYTLIFKQKKKLSDVNDLESLGSMLIEYTHSADGLFSRDVVLTLGHIQSFIKKKESFNRMISENFKDDAELSSMLSLVTNAEETLTSNIQKMVKRLSIFDFDDYIMFKRVGTGYALFEQKQSQFNDSINYIKDLCKRNEELLIELTNLITEVSQINDSYNGSNLSAIKDTVSAMKQLHFSSDSKIDYIANKYNN